MLIGAGLLVALPVAAAFGAEWLLSGMALGGLLGSAARGVGSWAGPASGRAVAARLARSLVLVLLAGVLARAFGVYLFPAQALLGSIGVLLVAVVVVALSGAVSPFTRRALIGLLVLAAVAFVLVCTGVDPVAPRFGGADGPPAVVGVVLAAAAVFALFTPLGGRQGVSATARWTPVLGGALGTVAVLAVGWAAVHQAGTVRIGLAENSLFDVLSAADADSLRTLFAAVIALGTIGVLAVVIADARDELDATLPARSRSSVARPGLSPASAALAGVLAAPAALFPASFALFGAAALSVAGIVLSVSMSPVPRASAERATD